MLGTGNDFILQGAGQVTEIIAIAGDSHDQITVFLGIRLRSAQCGCGDYVELDVMSAQAEVGAHQLRQLVNSILTVEQLRCELLVEQRPASAGMIHLRRRFGDGGRAVAVRALNG